MTRTIPDWRGMELPAGCAHDLNQWPNVLDEEQWCLIYDIPDPDWLMLCLKWPELLEIEGVSEH